MPQPIITTFERKELKYLINSEQKQALLQDLRSYFAKKGQEHYQLMSMYYDSPNKDFYWDKYSRVPGRKKMRIRRYVGQNVHLMPDEGVFIEIKEHTDTVNYKRRIQLKSADAFALLDHAQIPQGEQYDQVLLQEIITLVKHYHLLPSSVISYQREAFQTAKQYDNIRITFDQNIHYRINDLSLDWKEGTPLLKPGMEVMEIKIQDGLPQWLHELLLHYNIDQVPFSKYIQSIDLGMMNMSMSPSLLKKSSPRYHLHNSLGFQSFLDRKPSY